MIINKELLYKNLENLYLWVGAGVSSISPTNLPLGNSLSMYYLREILGSESEELIQKYSELNSLLTSKELEEKIPRVELLFQIFKEFNENKLTTVNDSLEIFGIPRFNENHFNLAILFKHGVTIFTTNFDTCIEDSYEYIFGEALEFDERTNSYSNPENIARIVHCHGIYKNINTLGINLDNVTVLNEHVKNKINQVLLNNNLLIMLGYSLSDDLDINKLFRNVNQKLSKCNILYINHYFINCTMLDSRRRGILENGFSVVLEEIYDTKQFLREFKDLYFDNNNYNNREMNFDFEKQLKACSLYIDINVFKAMILEYMGIRLKGIKMIEYKNNEYANKYVFRVFKTRSICFTEDYYKNAIDELECLELNLNATSWIPINRISWVFYKKNIELTLNNEDIENVKKILKLINRFIDEEFVTYKGQLNIKRNKAVLLSFLNEVKESEKLLNEVKDEFYEIGNLDGVLSVYIDFYYLYAYQSIRGIDFEIPNNLISMIESALLLGVQNKHKENYGYIKNQLSAFKKNS